MINLRLTQQQWDCAIAEVNKINGDVLTTKDGVNYTFYSNLIDAEMKYGNGILLVDIIHKHGIAKFASEATIQQHLQDLLGAMQCSNTPAPVLN